MDNRPIGVFDSGLGGLTAMRELIRTLPNESILYFGDTGRVPYGSRGREIIRKYAKQDMNFLIRHDVKAVLAACGTVSSVARDIGDALPVPYFDVLRPTARAAVEQTKNGKIGIIGTAATIASGSYRKEIERLAPKTEVFEQACPLFVPLVENAFVSPDDPIPRLTAERYLTPIRRRYTHSGLHALPHHQRDHPPRHGRKRHTHQFRPRSRQKLPHRAGGKRSAVRRQNRRHTAVFCQRRHRKLL